MGVRLCSQGTRDTQEEMASSHSRGGLSWIFRKMFFTERLQSIGKVCQGSGGVPVPRVDVGLVMKMLEVLV